MQINPTTTSSYFRQVFNSGNCEESSPTPTLVAKEPDKENATQALKSENTSHDGFNQKNGEESPVPAKSLQDKFDDATIRELEKLKQRDQEVRAHEAAHLAAAGQYATGAATYSYQRGPDGKQYAVGGEVQIDTSEVPGNPEATLRKARQIQAAAHAPAQPSAQDRQVAMQAAQMAAQARIEISAQQQSTSTFASDEKSITLSGENPSTTDEQHADKSDHSAAVSAYQSIKNTAEDSTKPLVNLIT